MEHDFKKFPELTNEQMDLFYFESPHKQIVEDFEGVCVKVIDGDTIKVKWKERKDPVTIRLAEIQAPELTDENGIKSKKWLSEKVLNSFVELQIDPENRVEKYGRILARLFKEGVDINEESVLNGMSEYFDDWLEKGEELNTMMSLLE